MPSSNMFLKSNLPEIHEIPVISTLHLKDEDREKLCGWRERKDLPPKASCLATLVTLENEYGWILWDGGPYESEFDEAVKEFFSEELLNLLLKFRSLGISYIWFDADGPEVLDLDVF